MSTATLLHSLFQYKIWANEELFSEVEKLNPVSQQAELHSAIRILNHVYVVDRIFAAHLIGASHKYTATNTAETPLFAELREAVGESDKWYVEYVKKLDPSLLQKKIRFSFTDGDNGEMSHEEILAHIATHGGYHRGSVGRILAQVSIPPPRDIFTRYLHTTDQDRRG